MSNARVALAAASGLIALCAVGGGGFYIGALHERVAHLEQMSAAEPQAPAQVAALAPSVQTPGSPAAQAPVAAGAYPSAPSPLGAAQADGKRMTDAGVPEAVAPVLADAARSASLLATLEKTSGIEAPGEKTGEHPILAFFDPRCPYCKGAMRELNGKANVKWVPVGAIGPAPEAAAMVSAMQGADPSDAVRLAGAGNLPKGESTDQLVGELNDNMSVLVALYQGAEDYLAVPTFLIPRADGTLEFKRGWDSGDGSKVLSDYNG